MGRAMLIIVAGVLISLGITQTSVFGGLNNLAGHSANYAEATQAQNIAYMGSEMAIRAMLDDPDWRNGQRTFNVDGGQASVGVEETGTDDQIRLVSVGRFNGETQRLSLLLDESENSLVPRINSALGLYMDNASDYSFGISGGGNNKGQIIDGRDASGQCEDLPGVMASDSDAYKDGSDLDDESDNINGDSKFGYDPDMDFNDVVTLIEALHSGTSGVDYTNLQNKVDQDDFGDVNPETGIPDPGVFVVDNTTAKISGNTVGSGILIVRSSGNVDVEVEADLQTAGTPEFHGLVIFENAFALSSSGAVEIFGSVLVGKSNENAPKFDIQFNGKAKLQYDCRAQQYADMAASRTARRVFQQLSVYQTSVNPSSNSNSEEDDSLLEDVINGLL